MSSSERMRKKIKGRQRNEVACRKNLAYECFEFKENDMLKKTLIASVFMVIAAGPSLAATVDGKLVSIDSESRTITMETGEIWNLTEYVILDGLEPGQLVRVTYTDETIDATAVDILEENPPIEPASEPVQQ